MRTLFLLLIAYASLGSYAQKSIDKDHFYNLSTGDSVALPVYNADERRILPVSGSTFDEGNVANGGGCAVRTDNGKINLKETIRNGVFGSPPRNDAQQTFEIKYRLNDGSGKSLDAVVGGDESSEYLRQSASIVSTWGEGGVTARYEEIDGANHFTVIDPLTNPASAMCERLKQLVSRA